MLNQYNSIAPFYDFLARAVFGESIIRCQTVFIPRTSLHAKVLVLGGGTGWILHEIVTRLPNSEIYYVEASKKMIDISRTRHVAGNKVHYIHGTHDNVPSAVTFDVVITHFFLDQFSEAELISMIDKIRHLLAPGGMWLASDFVSTPSYLERALLLLMYRFFRVVAGLRVQSLPPWRECIANCADLRLTGEMGFRRGFIASTKFEKMDWAGISSGL